MLFNEQNISKNLKVGLFGTCNNSTWRDKIIPLLECDYFNPNVDNWTPECQQEELHQRKICHYILYIITPNIAGYYSIAEVVDDSNKRPYNTLFCILSEEDDIKFDNKELHSLEAVKRLVKDNGAKVFENLGEVVKFLNEESKKFKECKKELSKSLIKNLEKC